MRRKDDTLRDTLLEQARYLADTRGPEAISIRALAQGAGVATGTVYNYFTSKDDILLALTEKYWRRTLLELRAAVCAPTFAGQLEEMYAFLRAKVDSSGGMLMRSLGAVEPAGQARMAAMQTELETAMIRRLDQDPAVRQDIWDGTFTKEGCARFLTANLTLLLRTGAPDAGFLLALVRRILY